MGTLVAARIEPPGNKDTIVARSRETTAEKLRVVADPTSQPASPVSPKSDPRLVNLVRLLARQAARDFVQAESSGRNRDRLPN
jgi:hypothetical protein